jgi:HPt (histidine-containing phosphotransfer) domain-containing protein
MQPERSWQAQIMPDLSGISVPTAMAYCEGDLALLRELLGLLRQHNAKALSKLRELLRHGDTQAAHRVAHSLKAAAGQIGALGLSRAAMRLERQIREQPQRVHDKLLEQVETRLGEVLRSIALLDQHLAPSCTPVGYRERALPSQELVARCGELAALIDDDVGGALDLLEGIEEISGSDPELVAGLKAIRAALRAFDLPSAQRLTRRLSLLLEQLNERAR